MLRKSMRLVKFTEEEGEKEAEGTFYKSLSQTWFWQSDSRRGGQKVKSLMDSKKSSKQSTS